MTLSIRARLTLWYCSIVVVVLVTGAVVASFVQVATVALQRLDDELARTMATLEGVMRTEFGEGLTLEGAAEEASIEVVVPDRTMVLTRPDGAILEVWGLPMDRGSAAADRHDVVSATIDDARRRAAGPEPAGRVRRPSLRRCRDGAARRRFARSTRDGARDGAGRRRRAARCGRRRLVDRATDAEAADPDGRPGAPRQRAGPERAAGGAAA